MTAGHRYRVVFTDAAGQELREVDGADRLTGRARRVPTAVGQRFHLRPSTGRRARR